MAPVPAPPCHVLGRKNATMTRGIIKVRASVDWLAYSFLNDSTVFSRAANRRFDFLRRHNSQPCFSVIMNSSNPGVQAQARSLNVPPVGSNRGVILGQRCKVRQKTASLDSGHVESHKNDFLWKARVPMAAGQYTAGTSSPPERIII